MLINNIDSGHIQFLIINQWALNGVFEIRWHWLNHSMKTQLNQNCNQFRIDYSKSNWSISNICIITYFATINLFVLMWCRIRPFAHRWGHGGWCKPSCIPIAIILTLIVLVVLLPLIEHNGKLPSKRTASTYICSDNCRYLFICLLIDLWVKLVCDIYSMLCFLLLLLLLFSSKIAQHSTSRKYTGGSRISSRKSNIFIDLRCVEYSIG